MSVTKLFPGAGRDFEDVPLSPLTGAQLRRAPAAAVVTPTGEARLNANSSILLGQLAHEAGLDPTQFSVTFGVNVSSELVAVYPVAHGTPGAAPVRMHKGRRVMSIHLSGVFQAHPSLRVDGRRQCAITVETTAKGVPCLVLGLQAALTKPKIARPKAKKEQPATTKDTKDAQATAVSTGAAATAPTDPAR